MVIQHTAVNSTDSSIYPLEEQYRINDAKDSTRNIFNETGQKRVVVVEIENAKEWLGIMHIIKRQPSKGC